MMHPQNLDASNCHLEINKLCHGEILWKYRRWYVLLHAYYYVTDFPSKAEYMYYIFVVNLNGGI